MTEYVDYEKTYQVPISTSLNKVVKRIVETVAWVNIALILLIVFTVILRYGFHRNQMFLGLGLVPLEELQWHLYAVVMMFGLAYAITIDSHIRIDIIHMNMSKPFQHFFEIFGIIFLLLPALIILLDFGIDYATYSFDRVEGSESPSGLPHRWIVKSVIPLTMILMIIATVSRLIQEISLMWHHGHEPKETRGSTIRYLLTPQEVVKDKTDNEETS